MNQLRWGRGAASSGSLLVVIWIGLLFGWRVASADIRVLVWDERQPRQKEAYSNWLGNEIAAHLRKVPGLKVTSSSLDDPGQGLGELDRTDVLVWWGHVRQMEIEPPVAKDIVRRIRDGRLQLIALHSAHWSRPFVEAMNERARQDALAALPESERATAVLKESELFPAR